jgi:putative hydrolase of the HAD superfamily
VSVGSINILKLNNTLKYKEIAMVRILIFDIGGVLVNVNIRRFVRGISRALQVSRWRLYFYRNRKLFDEIMRGEKTILALREDIMDFFKRDLDLQDFERIWNSILEAPRTEMLALAQQLGQQYQTVLLSNIEAAHHRHLQKSMEIFPYFSAQFMSYEMKLAKPDLAIYEAVLAELKASPGECFFIDDRRENIAAAQKLGIRSHLFRNAPKLRRDLQRRGILD